MDLVHQIGAFSTEPATYARMLPCLWHRLLDVGQKRHVLKALTLLAALLRLEALQIQLVFDTRERINDIKILRGYACDAGELKGADIRRLASRIHDFVMAYGDRADAEHRRRLEEYSAAQRARQKKEQQHRPKQRRRSGRDGDFGDAAGAAARDRDRDRDRDRGGALDRATMIEQQKAIEQDIQRRISQSLAARGGRGDSDSGSGSESDSADYDSTEEEDGDTNAFGAAAASADMDALFSASFGDQLMPMRSQLVGTTQAAAPVPAAAATAAPATGLQRSDPAFARLVDWDSGAPAATSTSTAAVAAAAVPAAAGQPAAQPRRYDARSGRGRSGSGSGSGSGSSGSSSGAGLSLEEMAGMMTRPHRGGSSGGAASSPAPPAAAAAAVVGPGPAKPAAAAAAALSAAPSAAPTPVATSAAGAGIARNTSELTCYAKYFNIVLQERPQPASASASQDADAAAPVPAGTGTDWAQLSALLPLDTRHVASNVDVLRKLGDGRLLSAYLNHIVPGAVDMRALDALDTAAGAVDASAPAAARNLRVAVLAAQGSGVAGFTPAAALPVLRDAHQASRAGAAAGLLWQLVKRDLLGGVDPRRRPRMGALRTGAERARRDELRQARRAGGGASVDAPSDEFLFTAPDKLLLRWLKHHLQAEGCDRAAISFRDGRVYLTLMRRLLRLRLAQPQPEAPAAELDGAARVQMKTSLDTLDALAAEDSGGGGEKLTVRVVSTVLDVARAVGVAFVIHGGDVTGGNPRLNLAFTASLFGWYDGLTGGDGDADADAEAEGSADALAQRRRSQIRREWDAEREDRAFCSWINSLGLDGVPQLHSLLGGDLCDGLALLRLLDRARAGCVDWRRAELRGLDNRMRRIANCNLVVETAQGLGMSVVNVGGADIVDGSAKLTIALVWQIMRAFLAGAAAEAATAADAATAAAAATASQGPAPPEKQGGPASHSQPGHLADFEKRLVAWVNAELQRAGRSNGAPAPQPRRISGFGDAQLKTGLVLLDLVDALTRRDGRAGVVDWTVQHCEPATRAQRLQNARYALTAARKLGCAVFLQADDVADGNARMLTTLAAALQTWAQAERQH